MSSALQSRPVPRRSVGGGVEAAAVARPIRGDRRPSLNVSGPGRRCGAPGPDTRAIPVSSPRMPDQPIRPDVTALGADHGHLTRPAVGARDEPYHRGPTGAGPPVTVWLRRCLLRRSYALTGRPGPCQRPTASRHAEGLRVRWEPSLLPGRGGVVEPPVHHPQDLARERPDELVGRRPPRVLGRGVPFQPPGQRDPLAAALDRATPSSHGSAGSRWASSSVGGSSRPAVPLERRAAWQPLHISSGKAPPTSWNGPVADPPKSSAAPLRASC
jgi:hypothetical protein